MGNTNIFSIRLNAINMARLKAIMDREGWNKNEAIRRSIEFYYEKKNKKHM